MIAVVLALAGCAVDGGAEMSSTPPAALVETGHDTGEPPVDSGDGRSHVHTPTPPPPLPIADPPPRSPSPFGCTAAAWAAGWERAEAPVLEAEGGELAAWPASIVADGAGLSGWLHTAWFEDCGAGAICEIVDMKRVTASADGLTWTRDGVALEAFGRQQRSAHAAVELTPDASPFGTWTLVYAAEGANQNPRIHHTTHPTRRYPSGAPVLGEGDGWEDRWVTDPAVGSIGDRWALWYTGATGGQPDVAIGLAWLGDDGLWVRHGDAPVLGPGPAGSHDAWGVEQPAVLSFSDCAVMFYGARPSAASDEGSIGLAVSTDGVSWDRLGVPLLEADPAAGLGALGHPAVAIDDRAVWLMIGGGLSASLAWRPLDAG